MTSQNATVVMPRMKDLTAQDHSTLVSSFQTIQPAINSAVSAAVANLPTQSQFYQLQQQIAAILNQLVIINQEIAALQAAGGTTATFPVTQLYRASPAISSYPVAVYESAPGTVSVADNSTLSTATPVIGLATANAPGGKVSVTILGEVTASSLALTPDAPVFLGSAGALTQTPPSTGYVDPIGVAVSATTVFVNVGQLEGFSTGNTDLVVGRALTGELNLQWLPLLPSLNQIPAGDTVTVPSFANLLLSSEEGLDLQGDLVLNGPAEFLLDITSGSSPTSGGSGIGVVDFGSTRTDQATLVITGQGSIGTSSSVEASILVAPTSSHSADEHIFEEIDIRAGDIVAGTGFTIYAQARRVGLHGQYNVAWRWS